MLHHRITEDARQCKGMITYCQLTRCKETIITLTGIAPLHRIRPVSQGNTVLFEGTPGPFLNRNVAA